MNKKSISLISFTVLAFAILASVALAKGQKFISIEPHMGFAGSNSILVGGKVYNYEGLNWTRNAYYNKPEMILKFNKEKIKFQPDSEGYFWVELPLKQGTKVKYGTKTPNLTTVSLYKYQNRKNKNLILVTSYGMNTDKIHIPFIATSPKAKFGIITDFDETITIKQGFGFIEQITTNPDIFKLRNGIIKTYQIIQNNINPIFYVTERPNGTYKVVKTLIKKNGLPVGPILARNLGFWFLNKGVSVSNHKINSIENILDTVSEKRFILIGDNSQQDVKIYRKIQQKYPNRIIKIFIFKNKKTRDKSTDDLIYIEKPEEITNELRRLGLIE